MDHFREQFLISLHAFEKRSAVDQFACLRMIFSHGIAPSSSCQAALDFGKQTGRMNWLRNVSVHTTGETSFLVPSHGMRGHSQYGDVRSGLLFKIPNRRGSLHTV